MTPDDPGRHEASPTGGARRAPSLPRLPQLPSLPLPMPVPVPVPVPSPLFTLLKRLRAPGVFALLATTAGLLLAWSAWQWQAARGAHAVVDAAGAAPVPGDAASAAIRRDGDPRALIPQASRLRAEGRHDDAVRILQGLATRTDLDADTAQVVRFNLGNELLALALQHNTKGDEDRAMTLIELSKQRFREVLRAQPPHWDARHNLDIALRLVPETEPPPPDGKPTNIQRIQVDLRGMRGVDLP